jgi:hypothetical protein
MYVTNLLLHFKTYIQTRGVKQNTFSFQNVVLSWCIKMSFLSQKSSKYHFKQVYTFYPWTWNPRVSTASEAATVHTWFPQEFRSQKYWQYCHFWPKNTDIFHKFWTYNCLYAYSQILTVRWQGFELEVMRHLWTVLSSLCVVENSTSLLLRLSLRRSYTVAFVWIHPQININYYIIKYSLLYYSVFIWCGCPE